MRKNTVLGNIVAAAFYTIAAFPLLFVSLLIFGSFSVNFVFAALTLTCAGEVLLHSKSAPGRVVAAIVTISIIGVAAVLLSTPLLVVIGLITISSIRSLFRYQNLLSAFADLVLTLAAFCFACLIYLLGGNFVLSIWSFFLAMSLRSLVPSKLSICTVATNCNSGNEGPFTNRFSQAYHTADEVLRRLLF